MALTDIEYQFSAAQIKAMESIFAFSEAMKERQLSINDLEEIISAALAEGHDILAIHVFMLARAIEKADEKRHTP